MTNKNPWALWLADWCDLGVDPYDKATADELRRLHEENETLKKCLFQMQNAAIELAKPEQKFYPDWDMIKPFHERIKELEVQLVKAGVMR